MKEDCSSSSAASFRSLPLVTVFSRHLRTGLALFPARPSTEGNLDPEPPEGTFARDASARSSRSAGADHDLSQSKFAYNQRYLNEMCLAPGAQVPCSMY